MNVETEPAPETPYARLTRIARTDAYDELKAYCIANPAECAELKRCAEFFVWDKREPMLLAILAV